MTVSFTPSLLVGYLRLSPSVFSACEVVASVATIIAMIFLGALSQNIGRRLMMLCAGASLMIFETLGIYLAVEFTKSRAGFFPICAAIVLIRVATSGPLGVMICYLNERFPTRVRSTGYSIGYAGGLVIPGLYSFYLLWLSRYVPYEYTALIFTVLGGALTIFSVWIGPETKNVELLSASDSKQKKPAQEAVVAG
jgi:MFS family permease